MVRQEDHPITFRLAVLQDRAVIKEWWTKPHVVEFWDNSSQMWQNVENYLLGRKEIFDYWVGFYDNQPFALFLTSELEKNLPKEDSYAKWIEAEDKAITIDFMIGSENFLGKKLSHITLNKFAYYMKESLGATIAIIDPAATNSKAVHVYQKAGFEIVDTFYSNTLYFSGIKHYLMRMKLK